MEMLELIVILLSTAYIIILHFFLKNLQNWFFKFKINGW